MRNSFLVEWVVQVSPQAQWTRTSWYAGWIFFFMEPRILSHGGTAAQGRRSAGARDAGRGRAAEEGRKRLVPDSPARCTPRHLELESPPTAVYYLYLTAPGMPAQKFILERPVTTIGRSSMNDLPISDKMLSRQHARIVRDGSNSLTVE